MFILVWVIGFHSVITTKRLTQSLHILRVQLFCDRYVHKQKCCPWLCRQLYTKLLATRVTFSVDKTFSRSYSLPKARAEVVLFLTNMKNVWMYVMIIVGLAGQLIVWLCLAWQKLINVAIVSDTVNVINVKLCMIMWLIELYLFIPLSVTVTIF